MAHEHNDECKRLHGIVESLVARQGVPEMTLASGLDVGILPATAPGNLESDPSDNGNLELEIASARQALEAMGCEG